MCCYFPDTETLCGEPPHVSNAVITEEYRDMFLNGSTVVYGCKTSYSLNGPESVVCVSGVWTQTPTCYEVQRHTGRPQPTGSGPFLPVDKCGEKPVVENGDYIYDDNRMALTYECNLYYKLVGPKQVMCHSNGVWSKTPVCKGGRIRAT
ncbi:hypothetical protein DPEC_G00056000 [Dallia pectoralis]|uniref:Uncharacterized protein n=1 Tax=Dallia pectoralis TaxID=75939 RepID=A0ACC2H6B8_DALPE|nr:hypothetical protein DPEC_G00056000 [Dallia pectoralis]